MLKKNMSCNNFTEEIKWICPWIEENMGILLQRKESGNGDGRAGVARNPEGCLGGESYRDVTAASHRRTSSPTVPWTRCVFPTAGPWCCQFPHPGARSPCHPPPPPERSMAPPFSSFKSLSTYPLRRERFSDHHP